MNLIARLANIDSRTGSEKGLDAVGSVVAEAGRTQPGCHADRYRNTKILLMAYLDTIFADGTAAARPFQIEGDHAYELGVRSEQQQVAKKHVKDPACGQVYEYPQVWFVDKNGFVHNQIIVQIWFLTHTKSLTALYQLQVIDSIQL